MVVHWGGGFRARAAALNAPNWHAGIVRRGLMWKKVDERVGNKRSAQILMRAATPWWLSHDLIL